MAWNGVVPRPQKGSTTTSLGLTSSRIHFSAAPPTVASGIAQTRYVDYYARNADNKARLHLSLPANAELWLNGQRMKGTGPERDFITPPLKEGTTYAYQVKARWTQDGQPLEETIEVKVRANKAATVRLGTSTLATR
jgi:uncharacterized protein (TIGR03000 family)